MQFLKKVNIALFLIPILIFSLSLLTLLSTSQERAGTHLIFFVLGYVLYVTLTIIDLSIIEYVWKYIYGIGLVLLFLTFLVADLRFGAARWLSIGAFGFQPSEIAKLILIVSLAAFVSKNYSHISEPKILVRIFLLLMPYIFFVFIQPDLGTSLVLVAASVGILFYANLNRLYFLYGFILFGIFSTPIWHLLKDYQKQRILVFLNPQLDVLGSGYNVIQAMIAIGSGGLFGKGFGQGTQASLNFLPAHWTDFIFASFAEEWGFIGVMLLLILFLVLLLNILNIAKNTANTYSRLVVIGIFFVFLFQFLVNVGMNLGIMPVTGIPLPFMSYGGSSMLVSFVMLAFVQNTKLKAPDF